MDKIDTFLLGFAIGIVGTVCAAAYDDQFITMREAFDRGYAVQCVGKTGYYWECE